MSRTPSTLAIQGPQVDMCMQPRRHIAMSSQSIQRSTLMAAPHWEQHILAAMYSKENGGYTEIDTVVKGPNSRSASE